MTQVIERIPSDTNTKVKSIVHEIGRATRVRVAGTVKTPPSEPNGGISSACSIRAEGGTVLLGGLTIGEAKDQWRIESEGHDNQAGGTKPVRWGEVYPVVMEWDGERGTFAVTIDGQTLTVNSMRGPLDGVRFVVGGNWKPPKRDYTPMFDGEVDVTVMVDGASDDGNGDDDPPIDSPLDIEAINLELNDIADSIATIKRLLSL